MYMFRKMSLINFILTIVAGYILVFMFSPSFANFLIAFILVAMIPILILRFFMLDSIYKNSINIVDKKYVLNNNALHNDNCTVIYTPDEKIVVMENISDRRHMKRMFTLTKKQLRINKAWNRLCRIFDDFSSVDSLEAFYNYDTKVEVITIESHDNHQEQKNIKIERSNEGPKYYEMGVIQADPFGKDFVKRNAEGSDFVNMSGLKEQKTPNVKGYTGKQTYSDMKDFKEQEIYVEKTVDEQVGVNLGNMPKKEEYVEKDVEPQKVVKMRDLVGDSTKINVNAVESTELALLPGINIVMAKKIIEYRNANGAFKSIDEFLSIAKVKEHFIPKIREMVEIGQSKYYDPSSDDYEQGRIVDL